MMLILVLLGMYFDAVMVFVTSQSLLFRLALAILCLISEDICALTSSSNVPNHSFSIFCKNEACVNCGKETATTLT